MLKLHLNQRPHFLAGYERPRTPTVGVGYYSHLTGRWLPIAQA
jgi:hypothetical protein